MTPKLDRYTLEKAAEICADDSMAGAFYANKLYALAATQQDKVPDGWKLLKDTTFEERSFPEHLGHENGNYSCTCCVCLRQFQGHKRSLLCKVCAAAPASGKEP